jgi:hypothetical protein
MVVMDPLSAVEFIRKVSQKGDEKKQSCRFSTVSVW